MDSTERRLMLILEQLGDTPEERKIAKRLQLELDHQRFQTVWDTLDEIRRMVKDNKAKPSLRELVAPWLPLASILGLLVAQVPLKDIALMAAKAFLK
jgi:hypothetical protein